MEDEENMTPTEIDEALPDISDDEGESGIYGGPNKSLNLPMSFLNKTYKP